MNAAPAEDRAQAGWSTAAFGAVTILSALICAAAIRLAPPPASTPWFPVAAIFFWGVFRPSASSPWFAGAVGLLQDALSGAPWGVHTAGYLVAAAATQALGPGVRREGFASVWAAFAVTAIAAAAGGWGAASMAARAVLPFEAAALQSVVMILLYPLLHRGFTALDTGVRRMG